MKRKNRVFAVVLAITLATSTFGSNFASSRSYAVESEEEIQQYQDGEATADEQISESNGDEAENSADSEDNSLIIQDENATIADNTDEVASSEDIREDVTLFSEKEVSDEADEQTKTDESAGGEAVEEVIAVEEPVKEEETITAEDAKVEDPAEVELTTTNDDTAADEKVVEGTEVENKKEIEKKEETKLPEASLDAEKVVAENMPAIEKNDVHTGGMVVSVSVDEGVFLEGTEIVISAISDEEAIETAKSELGEQITKAKGVDISFVYNGDVVQPADNQNVHVSLALDEAIEGENVSVLHEHNGDVETIDAKISQDEEGNTESVDFEVSQFSIFIIASDDKTHNNAADEHKIVKYEFYYGDTLKNTQVAKSGETIKNPGIPEEITGNQEFLGWYVEGSEEAINFPLDISTEGYEQDETVVKVYAKTETTCYVTFRGVDDEVLKIKKVVCTQDESGNIQKTVVAVDDVSQLVEVDEKAHKRFAGWTTEKGNADSRIEGNSIEVTGDTDLYALITTSTYNVYFDENDSYFDSENNKVKGGAEYHEPILVKVGEAPATGLENSDIPKISRPGYEFKGWFTGTKNSNNEVVLDEEFNWNEPRYEDVTVYAKWEEEGTADCTVIIWKQKITDDVDTAPEARTYDYSTSEIIKGVKTGSSVSVNYSDGKMSLGFGEDSYEVNVGNVNGFHYANKYKLENSETVSARDDTVINLYFDRDIVIIEFYNRFTPVDKESAKDGTAYVSVAISSDAVVMCPLRYKEDTDSWEFHYGDNWFSYNSRQFAAYKYCHSENEAENIKTLKGLYGQKVNRDDWVSDYPWKTTGETHITFLDAYILDEIPGAEFYEGGSTLKLIYYTNQVFKNEIRFWTQDLEGNNFELREEDSRKHDGFWRPLEKYTGFELDSYSKNGKDWLSFEKDGENYKAITIDEGGLDIRYRRKKYDLVFRYGNVPQSAGVVADGIIKTDDENIDGVLQVYYDTDINSSKNNTYSEYAKVLEQAVNNSFKNNNRTQYVLEGWYLDRDYKVPFDFDTTDIKMSDTGLILYAKLAPIGYTVTLDADGGKIPGGHTSLNYAWGEVVAKDILLNTTKEDAKGKYELVGWFTVNEELYDYNAKVIADITLKAKWRKPGKILVKYLVDSTISSGEPVDRFKYAEESAVRVLSRPKNVDKKHMFIGWELLDKNDNVVAFFYPNDCFDIGNNLIVKENQDEVVRLRAKFEELGAKGDVSEVTSVRYDANFENGGQTEAKVVNINEKFLAATYEETGLQKRENYIFLGWSINKFATAAEIKAGKTYIAVDNSNGENGNVLYAIWEKEEPEPTPESEPIPAPTPEPAPAPVPTPESGTTTNADPSEEPRNNNVPSRGELPTAAVEISVATVSESDAESNSKTNTEPTAEASVAVVAENPEVLGSKRKNDVKSTLPNVLGVRRGQTDDSTNILLRVIAIIAALLGILTLVVTGRKKDN